MTTPDQVQQIDGSDESDHDAQEIALGAALTTLLTATLLPGPTSLLRGSKSWDDQVEAAVGPTLQGFLQRSAVDLATASDQPGASALALTQAEETYPVILRWIQDNSMKTLQNLTDSNTPEAEIAQAAQGAAENLARGAAVYAKSEVRNKTAGKLGVTDKIWRTRHDAKVRPTHADLDGEEVPFDSTFHVGDIPISYPGDPEAPIELTANCRCHLVYHLRSQDRDYGESLTATALRTAHIFEEALHPRGADGKFIEKGDHVVITDPSGKKVEGVVEGFQRNGTQVKLDQGGRVLAVPHSYITQAPKAEADLHAITTARIAHATKHEPALTSLVEGIAKEHGGKAEGLDFRLKGHASLARKIQTDVDEAKASGGTLTHEEAANKLFDVNRYTITYPEQSYAEKAQQSIDKLKAEGYSLKVKNYWNVKDNPYQGINVQATGKAGEKFELQFHTRNSIDVKEGELHKVYEEQRIATNDTAKRVLTEKMHAISARIAVPPGVHSVSG